MFTMNIVKKKKIIISLWESREHPKFELEVMVFLIVLQVFIGKDLDEDRLKILLLGANVIKLDPLERYMLAMSK